MATWSEMASARPEMEARARALYLTSRATPVSDDELHGRDQQAVGDKPKSGASFEFDIERAMHNGRTGGRGYTVWRPGSA